MLFFWHFFLAINHQHLRGDDRSALVSRVTKQPPRPGPCYLTHITRAWRRFWDEGSGGRGKGGGHLAFAHRFSPGCPLFQWHKCQKKKAIAHQHLRGVARSARVSRVTKQPPRPGPCYLTRIAGATRRFWDEGSGGRGQPRAQSARLGQAACRDVQKRSQKAPTSTSDQSERSACNPPSRKNGALPEKVTV